MNTLEEVLNSIAFLQTKILKLNISDSEKKSINTTLLFVAETIDPLDKLECEICGNYWGP